MFEVSPNNLLKKTLKKSSVASSILALLKESASVDTAKICHARMRCEAVLENGRRLFGWSDTTARY